MLTSVRVVPSDGPDIGTWDMTAVPREGDLLVGPGDVVYEILAVTWYPLTPGGGSAVVMVDPAVMP